MESPKTLQEAIIYFSNEQVCIDAVAEMRWPVTGPVCPECDTAKPYYLKTAKRWKCRECRIQFSVKKGTIFEDSALSLTKWMPVLWLLVNCKNGISSYEVAKAIGVTQKSAWFMVHRLRLVLKATKSTFMFGGGEGGAVEVDETHLEQSVVIMLGVAALVITLIFGTTIIGEIRVIQAIKKLDSEAVEVKERFPKLSAMETQARIALKNIEVTFGIEGADTWLEDRYASLGIVERQRILTVEHLIALEFTGRSTPSQLRGMSNFYYSKFKFERLASDLDRSLYYAHLASDRGNEAFQYLNDLGFLYMELMEKDKRYREDAMRALLLSKGKHSKQQRCYYNIATLLFDEAIAKKAAGDAPSFYKMMSEIRQLLYTALLHPKWEIQASPELASLIHYNLACCLCGIVEQYLPLNTQHPLLDEALEHLQAASEFKQTKAETLVRDLDKQCGDLKALADNAFYAKRMHALRTAVEDRSA